MAKDDFFYVSYKILAYLYHAMKKAKKLIQKFLTHRITE